jgi:hypothetical protein
MGAASSKRAIKRRLDETQKQLNAAHDECNKLNGLLLSLALKDVQPTWYTAHGAKLRFGLSEEDLADIRPVSVVKGHPLYSNIDLHPLAEERTEQRNKLLEEEAKRYGIFYPGDFASHTCDWRLGRDIKSLEQVTLDAVRRHYLEQYTSLVYYMRTLERENTDWPAVWPWRREAVLAEGWEWTPEVHNYWFGPKFKTEAWTMLESIDVRENKAVTALTQLAKRHAANRGPLETS